MKKLLLLGLMLSGCGCGRESVNVVASGQVKTVSNETPLLCPDYTEVDVSLGVVHDGTGSMSTHDILFRVDDSDLAKVLREAAKSGKIIEVTYDTDRFRWCVETRVITSVKVQE